MDKQYFKDFLEEWACVPDSLNYVIEVSHDKSDKTFCVYIAQPRKDRIHTEVIYYKSEKERGEIEKWLLIDNKNFLAGKSRDEITETIGTDYSVFRKLINGHTNKTGPLAEYREQKMDLINAEKKRRKKENVFNLMLIRYPHLKNNPDWLSRHGGKDNE